jgi:hypothetical protein
VLGKRAGFPEHGGAYEITAGREGVHLAQRLALPAPGGQGRTAASGEGDGGTPGHDLNPALPGKMFDRLTALGRAAASRFNERR